jgi:inosine/xanthosine triphosphate pyrophosphatase family protein
MLEHLGVRYVYEDTEARSTASPAEVGVLTRDRLQGLPGPWLARFREAVGRGDTIEAAQLTTEIEVLDAAFAAAVRARLAAYQLYEIEELLAG